MAAMYRGEKYPRSDTSRTDHVYPRKRAAAACRACRARKIKCDNLRPSCGACQSSNATCIYQGPQDYSAFDPASLLILDRLDQVLSKLDQRSATDQSQTQSHTGPRQTSSDELQIPVARITPDAVLKWPIFSNRYPPDHLTGITFAARFEHLKPAKKPATTVGGVDETAIPELVKRFLDFVHIKNPILDTDTLWSYAEYAAEEGLKWDSASCLVLLASALGCISERYACDDAFSSEPNSMRLYADSYYNMARKRFGLLEDGLLAPQCHFLAGIYLMYKLQPLAAWPQFHMASTLCYIYLQCESHRADGTPEDRNTLDRRLEQSLYWSCYKSECELRVELNLPSSSLPELNYPDTLPTPPTFDFFLTSNSGHSPGGISDQTSPRKRYTSSAGEESWFYYLTEITLRRISNGVLSTFYSQDFSSWNEESIPLMIKAAEQYEQQLDEWYQTLPALISFNEDEVPGHELRYLARDRMLEIRNWLYRPFLYFAIHAAPDSPCRGLVKHLVDKAILYSMRTVRDEPVHHRHHGTWFAIRGAVSIALGVLGAAICGMIDLPDDWKTSMDSCIDKVRYWQDESPDVFEMGQVLADLLEECRDA